MFKCDVFIYIPSSNCEQKTTDFEGHEWKSTVVHEQFFSYLISQNVHVTFHTFTLSTSCKDYTDLRAPSTVSWYLLLRHVLSNNKETPNKITFVKQKSVHDLLLLCYHPACSDLISSRIVWMVFSSKRQIKNRIKWSRTLLKRRGHAGCYHRTHRCEVGIWMLCFTFEVHPRVLQFLFKQRVN